MTTTTSATGVKPVGYLFISAALLLLPRTLAETWSSAPTHLHFFPVGGSALGYGDRQRLARGDVHDLCQRRLQYHRLTKSCRRWSKSCGPAQIVVHRRISQRQREKLCSFPLQGALNPGID